MNLIKLFRNIRPFVRPYRWLVVITLALTLVGSLMAQVNAIVLDRTVDAINALIGTDFTWAQAARILTIISIVLLGKELLSALINYFQSYFGERMRIFVSRDLSQSVIENALKRTFAPEFLNRVDDVVMFNSLEKKDIHKIIGIEIRHVVKRVEEMGYKIELTEKAMDFIAEKGWDEQYGARPLKRAVQKYVEDVLADAIISANLHIGDLISIDLGENGEETVVNIVPKSERILEEAVV